MLYLDGEWGPELKDEKTEWRFQCLLPRVDFIASNIYMPDEIKCNEYPDIIRADGNLDNLNKNDLETIGFGYTISNLYGDPKTYEYRYVGEGFFRINKKPCMIIDKGDKK